MAEKERRHSYGNGVERNLSTAILMTMSTYPGTAILDHYKHDRFSSNRLSRTISHFLGKNLIQG